MSDRIPTPEEQGLDSSTGQALDPFAGLKREGVRLEGVAGVASVTERLHARVDHDFRYHPPQPGQPESYEVLRSKARELGHLIVDKVPPGREQATALTRLEEAVMHANAGIARA